MKTRTPLPAAVTRNRGFGDVSRGVPVFSVQQGVSVVEALEYGLSLLSAASAQVKASADAASDVDGENMNWAAHYLLESVEALLSASISGLREAEQ